MCVILKKNLISQRVLKTNVSTKRSFGYSVPVILLRTHNIFLNEEMQEITFIWALILFITCCLFTFKPIELDSSMHAIYSCMHIKLLTFAYAPAFWCLYKAQNSDL